MTIGESIRNAAAALAAVSDTPRLDAEILLAHGLGVSRAKLLAMRRDVLRDCGFEGLLARRLSFEPIAYILGEWEFFSMRFACRAPILVPRPETEHLVECALNYATAHEVTRVLDLCTGTGCVAIALARHLPQAEVLAVDLNPDAVSLARENATRNGVGVRVFEGDLFDALPDEGGFFDVIVSNPPYVAEGEWAGLPEVIKRHEDPLALLSGAEGLDCIYRIADESRDWLRTGGLLAMEIGESQGAAVVKLLEDSGYAKVGVITDLAGHDRIVHGVLRDLTEA